MQVYRTQSAGVNISHLTRDHISELEAHRARTHRESVSQAPLGDQYYEVGPARRISPMLTVAGVTPIRSHVNRPCS